MEKNIIEIENLARSFGTIEALKNINLQIKQGIVYGIVGENGAGKTTFIKHILGLLKAQTGSVRVFGYNPAKNPVDVLSKIGYLSEERDIPDWMTISEFMNYSQAFYPNWDNSFASELIDTFKLIPNKKIGSLSKGQKAQTGLIAALAHRPPLLLLDEPSSGLDPIVRRDILSAIIRTIADEGRTVIFSSHLLEEVERVSDEIALINKGEVLLNDSLDSIKSKFHYVTVQFEQPVTDFPQIPDIYSISGSGREWSFICNNSGASIEKITKELGVSIVRDEHPTLEEIFIAKVKG